MKKIIYTAIALLLIPSSAAAESSVTPQSLRHKASIELSTGTGTGNVDAQSFRLAGKLVSNKGSYTNELHLNVGSVDSHAGKTESVHDIGDKLKYAINDKSYAFGELNRYSKRAAGISGRSSETIGYGHNLIKTDSFDLTGEVAAGLRQSNYKTGLEDENSMLGKIGTNMDWQIYNNVLVNNNTYMGYTEGNTQTVSDTSVKTYVYKDKAYVKGSLEVENNSKVPAGYKKSDAITLIGVGYEF